MKGYARDHRAYPVSLRRFRFATFPFRFRFRFLPAIGDHLLHRVVAVAGLLFLRQRARGRAAESGEVFGGELAVLRPEFLVALFVLAEDHDLRLELVAVHVVVVHHLLDGDLVRVQPAPQPVAHVVELPDDPVDHRLGDELVAECHVEFDDMFDVIHFILRFVRPSRRVAAGLRSRRPEARAREQDARALPTQTASVFTEGPRKPPKGSRAAPLPASRRRWPD